MGVGACCVSACTGTTAWRVTSAQGRSRCGCVLLAHVRGRCMYVCAAMPICICMRLELPSCIHTLPRFVLQMANTAIRRKKSVSQHVGNFFVRSNDEGQTLYCGGKSSGEWGKWLMLHALYTVSAVTIENLVSHRHGPHRNTAWLSDALYVSSVCIR